MSFWAGPFYTTAAAWVNFSIGVDSYGRLHYSGRGGASLTVDLWVWKPTLSVGIGISNTALSFQIPVINHWVSIPLPH